MSGNDSPDQIGSKPRGPTGDSSDEIGIWAALTVITLLVINLLPSLIRPAEFMQDDSYFYLQVAHNIVAGLGSTFHGITPTNGYHPLWMGLVTATSFMAGGDKTASLYFVFALQGVLFIASALVFRRLAILMGLRYWLIGIAIMAAYLLGTAIYGSEAHVNALTLLASLALLWRALGSPRARPWFLTGLVAGLAVLARLDNVFVMSMTLMLGLVYSTRENLRTVAVPLLALVAGGAAVVLPYVLANLVSTGHMVPISGAIKSTFPNAQIDLGRLGSMGKLATPFGFVSLLIGLGLDKDRRRRVLWQGLGSGVILHAAYVVCFTDHYTFWAWYYVSAVLSAALSACYLYQWLTVRYESLVSVSNARRIALAGAVLVLVAGSARAWVKSYGYQGINVLGFTVRTNKYRWPDELGRWLKTYLPPGTRIFAYDWPGSIAFYSDLPLLPMDGLMNDFQYNDDLLEVGIQNYLCAHNIQYFFGLIEPWQRDIEVEVTAPLYRIPVGTLRLREKDIVVRTDNILARPDEALPFALWQLACPDQQSLEKRQQTSGALSE
ncbi:MAG: hypothetical protein JSW21_06055 [Gammaproteobacteria bacterium]|nr:MAG: hypothetical protein JSW21_06055 [Gammaproteobacteria bacterium]